MQQQHQIKLSEDEVEKAVASTSWKKALSTDSMPDTLLHLAAKNPVLLAQLTSKLQHFMNADYWPRYLFTARLIPLSKNEKAYTSLDQVRTISVIPPTAKLIERIILNRIQEQLYNNDSGLISPDQLGFRPGASC
jgi:hypothetical protein